MKLGILISGGGTTFLNLEKRIREGRLTASVACVISSSAKAQGLERARELGYPATCVLRSHYADDAAFSQAIDAELRAHGAELVILAGFLKLYLPAPEFRQRTLNIHPSLIPAFCGHGYYGMKVHEGVWARGCKVSGCTIHLVDAEYDAGPIVLQQTVALSAEDTPEDIRRKVFEAECEAYPRAIQLFVEDRVRVVDGRVFIRD